MGFLGVILIRKEVFIRSVDSGFFRVSGGFSEDEVETFVLCVSRISSFVFRGCVLGL